MILYHECIFLHNEDLNQILSSHSGGTLPIPEDINEFDVLEEKPDTLTKCAEPIEEKKLKRQIEEDDDDVHYYTNVYNDYLGSSLNFQFSFGEGGGQDWVVSKLFI